MKPGLLLIVAVAILTIAPALSAFGQDSSTEHIGPISVVMGQSIDLSFPNDFNLVDHKDLLFVGTATKGSLEGLSFLDVFLTISTRPRAASNSSGRLSCKSTRSSHRFSIFRPRYLSVRPR
jgi:hypothetical protein